MNRDTGKWEPISHTIPPHERSFRVPKLKEGDDYKFRVRAVNDLGAGEPLETEKAVKIKNPFGENLRNSSHKIYHCYKFYFSFECLMYLNRTWIDLMRHGFIAYLLLLFFIDFIHSVVVFLAYVIETVIEKNLMTKLNIVALGSSRFFFHQTHPTLLANRRSSTATRTSSKSSGTSHRRTVVLL